MNPIRVTIWNEFYHELTDERARANYPDGIHACLARALAADDLEIRTAWLEQDKEHGLSEKVLKDTDGISLDDIESAILIADTLRDKLAAKKSELEALEQINAKLNK